MIAKCVLAILGALAIVAGPWRSLIDRPLWHDEEQIVFAADQLRLHGIARHLDAEGCVGENLHFPLDHDGRLQIMPMAEIRLAAWARSWMSGEDPELWRQARWPFALAGALAGLILALAVAARAGPAAGWCAGGLWFLNPWTWSLSCQLRYYPLCWLLVAAILWTLSGRRRSPYWMAALFLMLLYVHWVLAPLLLGLLWLGDRWEAREARAPWSRIVTMFVVGAVAYFVVGGKGSAILQGVPGIGGSMFQTLRRHLPEFNLDVFPVLLLAVMVGGGWRWRHLRPGLVAVGAVPLLLVIPSLYTRVVLMLLPLFVLVLVLVASQTARRWPGLTAMGLVLYGASAFWQVLPGASLATVSARLGRQVMPLNRSWSHMSQNTAEAWAAVTGPALGAMDDLVRVVKTETGPWDGILCASGGTGLRRQTGRTVHWKTPDWFHGREIPHWMRSPEGVRLVIVQRQWPYLSRSATWADEILQGLEEGWLRGRRITTSIPDWRFWDMPFPFSRHRQAWPVTEPLEIWLLDDPLSKDEARRVMARSPRLLRPAGVPDEADPDVIWGWPLSR